jgi:hypothetical protein
MKCCFSSSNKFHLQYSIDVTLAMTQYCQDILDIYIQICMIDVYYSVSRDLIHS